MDVVGAVLVGGGLLEVLLTALEKVAGGPLMEEVDLGPGVALRGGTERLAKTFGMLFLQYSWPFLGPRCRSGNMILHSA